MTDGTGESLYADTHITSQDDAFIRSITLKVIEQASAMLSSSTGTLSLDTEAAEAETTGTAKLLEELIATGVMGAWLEDKSAERSTAYKTMFYQMTTALRGRIRPSLMTDY